jgi:hypothetical protein
MKGKGIWAPKKTTTTPPSKSTPTPAPTGTPIGEVIKGLATGGKNVAGYIEKSGEKKTFVYVLSESLNLPAAAYVMDTAGKAAKTVYTNLANDHWILTYTKRRPLYCVTDETADPRVDVTRPLGGAKLSVLGGDRASLEPIPGGGLYAAAKRLAGGGKGNVAKGKDNGLERALRYYMLAGYSLLGLCAEAGYSEGNYIAALMVSDTGKILSFGVNSGFFHHGEVNMLFNYFSRPGNSTKAKFEENTIVFSTLTPCKQCTDYLLACKPTESHIYIGQADTGEFGKEGAKYFEFLDKVTKPPNIMAMYSSTLKKEALHSHLSSKMNTEEGMIAKQIGLKCKETLLGSAKTFVAKTLKDREGQGDPEEQALKHAVLTYLAGWLGTVSLTVR